MLHKDDNEYFNNLKEIGFKVAALECIKVKKIEPKRVCSGRTVGLCYCTQQRITIVVRQRDTQSWGGEWHNRRPHEKVLKTLAHELAHLQEFQNHGKTGHGKRFKAYMANLEEKVKTEDSYGTKLL